MSRFCKILIPWGSSIRFRNPERSVRFHGHKLLSLILNYLPIYQQNFMITVYLKQLRFLSPLPLSSLLSSRAELQWVSRLASLWRILSRHRVRDFWNQRTSPEMMATTWRTGGVLTVFCVLTVVTTFVNKVFRFCCFCFSFSFLLFFVRLNELNSRFFIRDRSLSFLNVLAVRP